MKSNIIQKINEWFAEQKFATDYTAVTGEIVRCLNSLAVGEKVVQVLQGEEAPLTDGQYVLDNGKAIEVLGGEIKSINDTTASENMGSEETTKEKTEDLGSKIEKLADYAKEIDTKLTDGTEVKILSKGEALSVGDEVLVKDASGEFVKAAEGKHLLEGGLTIYTDAEGFINELETEETDKEEDTNEEFGKKMFDVLAEIKDMVDELKSAVEVVKQENVELKEKMNKFSAEPSAPSITEKKHFSKVASKEDKLKFFSKR